MAKGWQIVRGNGTSAIRYRLAQYELPRVSVARYVVWTAAAATENETGHCKYSEDLHEESCAMAMIDCQWHLALI